MDLLWIVLGTWLFWHLVGGPVHDWAEGFRGTRVVGREGAAAGKPSRKHRSSIGGHQSRDQILEMDGLRR